MKHKFLSFIVIVFTVISVGVMVSKNMFNNNLGKDEHIAFDQEDSNKKQQNNTSVGNKNSTTDQKESEQQNQVVDEKIGIEGGVNTQTDTNAEKETPISKENTASETPSLKVVKSAEAAYPTNAAVFKIDADKVLDSITFVDKGKLLGVLTKISPVDSAKVINYLKDENYSRGIINTFKLLKMRLGSKDYDELRKVASKYVDVNCIESYIN